MIDFRTAVAEVVRVAGQDRYSTAAVASASAFATAPAVVIASGQGYADALAASGLCGALRSPLLLVPAAGPVPGEVVDEISRLGAEDAYIVGGTGAVSSGVFEELAGELGSGHVTRLAGTDRYDTAAQVAGEVASLEGTAPGGARHPGRRLRRRAVGVGAGVLARPRRSCS